MTMQDSFPIIGGMWRALLALPLPWRHIQATPEARVEDDHARRAFVQDMFELCPEAFSTDTGLHETMIGLSGRY